MRYEQLFIGQMMISMGLLTLIWIIQILHYPIFKYIDDELFPQAMEMHQKKISFVVVPMMILEAILSTMMAFIGSYMDIIILMLVIGIWTCTFLIQVPLHKKLLLKKNYLHIDHLVRTNWIRTFLWSIKFIFLGQQFIKLNNLHDGF